MSRKRQGKIWIEGMDSPMINATLAGRQFREELGERSSVSILPDVWVIKIGGQSIIDRGKSAVLPVLEELIAAHRRGVRFILCTGGGTRARHVYALGLDLNLPTGMLARLGSTVPVQNARMLQLLMARYGGIVIYPDDIDKLPFYLNTGCIPITSGMPPNEFWEKPAAVGLIPSNRTDAGVYLLGEFLGAKGVLYIKDEDGLYTDDPKKDRNAELIRDISAQALLESGQDDLIVERIVLEYLMRAEKARQIQIINGLKPGTIGAAFDGEPVGTIIRAA